MSLTRKLGLSLAQSPTLGSSAMSPTSTEGSTQSRDLAFAMDGSFVETTSAAAARALALAYHQQNGEEYNISTRIGEKGRTFYRIRPRSRSPPRANSSSSSEAISLDTAVTFTSGIVIPHVQDAPAPSPVEPSTLVRPAAPTPPDSASEGDSPRLLRTTRSIPTLHRPTPTGEDATPPSRGAIPLLTVLDTGSSDASHNLRRAGSSPSLAQHSGLAPPGMQRSLSAGRQTTSPVGGQVDVLGRLLGWGPLPAKSRDGSEGGSAKMDKLPVVPSEQGEAPPRESISDLPEDLATVLGSISASSNSNSIQPLATTSSSPFGLGVRSVSPSSTSRQRDPSGETLAGERTRSMREVASSDSIRTARALPTANRFEDPTIFDVLQGLDVAAAARPLDEHTRFPSSSSMSSQLSEPARHNAQQITVGVSAGPSDDPRFVIWGYKNTQNAARTTGGAMSPPGSPSPPSDHLRRGSISHEMEHSASNSSVNSPSASSSRFSSGRRGSRSAASDATSARPDSIGSGSSVAPPERVLMAATVERWVAELTSKISPQTLSGFFLIYRAFISPLDLLRLLLTRFSWALAVARSPEDEASRRIVSVRTFVVLRHWLLNHFQDDFVPSENKQVRTTLTSWLNATSRENHVKENVSSYKLLKGLKKIVYKLKELHVALRHADAKDAARVLAESEFQGGNGTAYDEDVDWDVDAPRPKSSAPLVATPSIAERGRVDLSPTASRMPQSVPLPGADKNPLGKGLNSALGAFGRFKRMLGNRAAASGSAGPSKSALDESDFDKTAVGDLLFVKDGLEDYLRLIRQAGNQDGDEEEQPLPVLDERRSEDTPSDATLDTPRDSATSERDVPQVHVEEPKAVVFSLGGDVKRADTFHPTQAQPQLALFDEDPDDSSFSRRPPSVRIELDDVDLSDEDEDVVEVKKTLKRLPGANNLRTANTVADFAPTYRGSIESVSSYGSPDFTPGNHRPQTLAGQRETVLYEDEGEDLLIAGAAQFIPGFILEGIDDSDEDDAGDVEAALRRLEGIVDEDKEKAKARKVERQMEKSNHLRTAIADRQSRIAMRQSMIEQQQQQAQVQVENSLPAMAEDEAEAESDEKRTAVVPEVVSDSTEPRELELVTGTPFLLPEAALGPPASTIGKAGPPLSGSTRQNRSGMARKPSASKLFAINNRPLSALRQSVVPKPVASPLVPTHRSFMLLCRTDILAQQFCLIERDMLRVLGWKELVSGEWQSRRETVQVLDWELFLKERRRLDVQARENGGRMPSAVQASIARFNLMAAWVCSEIVLTANLDERAAVMSKFIRLAFKSYSRNNFQTTTQIVQALQLPTVARLKKTWARVPSWEMRKFEGMKAFVSHVNNFKHLREATQRIVLEMGPAGQQSLEGGQRKASGCIPFIGIFLRDLTVNADLPTFLDPTSTNSPAEVSPSGNLLSVADPQAFDQLPPLPGGMPLRPLVNVHKFRAQAGVVQQLLACQEGADRGYDELKIEKGVYFKCLKIRALEADIIRQCAARLE